MNIKRSKNILYKNEYKICSKCFKKQFYKEFWNTHSKTNKEPNLCLNCKYNFKDFKKKKIPN